MLPEYEALRPSLKHLSVGDQHDIEIACTFAVHAHELQKREDGSPYVSHVIEVAKIVAEWGADRDTIVAALLHDVLEDTPVTKEEIASTFGRHAALLVDGITKFTVADLSPDLPLDRKIETLRKLFDVMRLDMRSIVIKLADRIHNVQTIGSLPPDRRKRFALETLSVYYKIAFHLGMRDVLRVFATYCVPVVFEHGEQEKIEHAELCREAEEYARLIERDLRAQDRKFLVSSVFLQPRNLLSFHERRLLRSGLALTVDASSVIIIVATEEACYRMLKSLHTLYRPVSGQFRDFIAAPSDAGYRSLHTYVTIPGGTVVECRIRTPEMMEQAAKGVTVALFDPDQVDPSFSWLKRSEAIDLQTRDSSGAFWEALESDVLREAISVTVDRTRLSLPKNATALDAVYGLYAERAGHTRSITVNGRLVSFGETLRDDDDLHIVFDEALQVTFDWLQMVGTQHARLLIVDILKRNGRSQKVALGAALLQKELDHYASGLIQSFSRTQLTQLAKHFRRDHFDDVLAMIGEGVLRSRDVVFYLIPDKKTAKRPHASGLYPFRFFVTGTKQPKTDILAQLNGIIRLSDVTVDRTELRVHPATHQFDLTLSGSAPDRLLFADFIDMLDRQEWVSKVQTLISRRQKTMLIGSFALAFAVIFLDILLLPAYIGLLDSLPLVPQFFIQSLPLIPILAASYYVLRLLQHYVVRMRNDRWFLGVGLLLNVIGLVLLVFRILLLQHAAASLLPLVIVFSLSMIYVGYTFFQTDALLAPFDESQRKTLSTLQWKKIRRRKTYGYFIRLAAVLIWGLAPIYIRYTSVNDLSPFLRTFLLGLGVLLPSYFYFVIRDVWKTRLLPRMSLTYDGAFLALLIGQIGYTYFQNASLIYTSGTNLLLFNNFAPVIGLLIAAFLWRKDISYFKQPKTMLWIFLLAIIAGIGSSLLAYNSSSHLQWTVFGDALAMVSTFFDVLLTIGQIEYIRKHIKVDGFLLNVHIFFFLVLLSAFMVIGLTALGIDIFQGLTLQNLCLSLGVGALWGLGLLLNYEAFKRIDGYLAYMMFNLSVLVTFMIEAFYIGSIQPSSLLVLSGLLIIGASVVAEVINSRCQKKGL